MIFAQPLFEQLQALHGDKAAWKLVDANAQLVQEAHFNLPFPDDINTAADFERLAATGKTERALMETNIAHAKTQRRKESV